MALFNSPIFIIPSVTFMMMLLQNTAIALLNPAAEAMIIDDSTPKNRSFIYAVDYWAMNLSIMFGSMIGGMFLMNIALNYLRCYPYHPLWYFTSWHVI